MAKIPKLTRDPYRIDIDGVEWTIDEVGKTNAPTTRVPRATDLVVLFGEAGAAEILQQLPEGAPFPEEGIWVRSGYEEATLKLSRRIVAEIVKFE